MTMPALASIEKKSFVSKSLITLALAHLINDMSQGAIPVLLPIFKEIFSLTYTQIGVIVLIMNFTSSIIQPLFGYIADKANNLRIIPLGLFSAGLGLALLGVMPSYYTLLIMIFLSGIGVAAFHPQALKAAYIASNPAFRGRSMGIFSVGGNAGFAVGSITASYLFSLSGSLSCTLWYILPTAIMTVFLYYTIKNLSSDSPSSSPSTSNPPPVKPGALSSLNYRLIGLLLLFIFNRSTIQTGLTTYIPLYFVSFLGGDHIFAGYVLSAFLFAGAFGTFIGAALSDKFGRKAVIIASTLASMPLIAIFPHTSGIAALIVVALAGIAGPASFATTIVFAQEMMPNNIGMASALTTGFSIGLGGIGALLLGYVADHFGVMTVFTILAVLPLAGAGIASFFPSKANNPALSN